MSTLLKIGHLAKVTQTTAPTIRYYEKIGLLPAPPRQPGSQRVYGEDDVQRLTFIRRCREIGFSIDRVRALMTLFKNDERPCSEARDIAYSHLMEVREKLREMQELERTIAALVGNCDRLCAGSVGAECVIFEELSETKNQDVVLQIRRTGCCSGTAASLLNRSSRPL